MTGPSAVAYTRLDPVILAKTLADFAKGHDKLRFRGGIVEGQLLDAKQAQAVATLADQAGAGGEIALHTAVTDEEAGHGADLADA